MAADKRGKSEGLPVDVGLDRSRQSFRPKAREVSVVALEPIRPVPPPEGKKPKRHENRTCSKEDCGTRLSMYNPGPDCYQHSPIRYPRVRGRPSS